VPTHGAVCLPEAIAASQLKGVSHGRARSRASLAPPRPVSPAVGGAPGGEFETKDVEATLATMVEDASVNHVPVGTGRRGNGALRALYRDDFIPSWPDDLQMTPVSQVIGEGQLVDELHVTFTHSKPMPWWSCNSAGANWLVSGSTGTTPPCCGKSGFFERSGERPAPAGIARWASPRLLLHQRRRRARVS
jgi:hypothetical protein